VGIILFVVKINNSVGVVKWVNSFDSPWGGIVDRNAFRGLNQEIGVIRLND